MGLSLLGAVANLVKDSKSMPSASRRLDWKVDVKGVLALLASLDTVALEEVASHKVDFTCAISIQCAIFVKRFH